MLELHLWNNRKYFCWNSTHFSDSFVSKITLYLLYLGIIIHTLFYFIILYFTLLLLYFEVFLFHSFPFRFVITKSLSFSKEVQVNPSLFLGRSVRQVPSRSLIILISSCSTSFLILLIFVNSSRIS